MQINLRLSAGLMLLTTLSASAQNAPSISASFYPSTIPLRGASNLTIAISNGFKATGNMTTPRQSQTATLLNNGTVLMAGGYSGSAFLSSAEVYNPSTGTFTAMRSMTTARFSHTATLLSNGQVLIAGGSNTGNPALASAEVYNPVTGTFTATGSMTTGRFLQTATLLSNGLVLMAGGYSGSAFLSSAELYNPATGTFTATGSMTTPRYLHTATLLSNGQVLMAGTESSGMALASAELYNPVTGTFTATGSMTKGRITQTATLLSNGKVLVAGGGVASAELYNPATGTFTATGSMTTPRESSTATLSSNGTVLIAGGISYITDSYFNVDISIVASTELYNPATGTFTATGSMTTPRVYHTETLLSNGKVLMAGGGSVGDGYLDVDGTLASAELYDSSTALTGVGVTDTLPAGITVGGSTSPACGGTLTTTAQSGITLSGATVTGGGLCAFTVTVTGAASGTYTIATGAVTSANGGTGNTASSVLSVLAPPTITAYSPTSVPAGSAAFTLNLSGTNFCSGSQVVWNSTNLALTYVSYTSITASVPASLVTSPATASISVVNPAGSCAPGGTSPSINFVVAGPSYPSNPAITVQPPLLRPAAAAGSTTPVMNSVNVRNINGTLLTTPLTTSVFQASGGPNWLTVIPQTSSDLKNGVLRFTTNPTGLTPGSYLGYVVYPGPGAAESAGASGVTTQCNQVSTAVVFTVGNPALTFSPLNPVLTAPVGGVTTDTINVTVNGISPQGASQGVPMLVTATTNDGAGAPCWLSISPLNIALQTGTPFQATASTANLSAATHIGGLAVQAGGQTASDAIVFKNAALGQQAFDVGTDPVINIDPNTLTGSIQVASIPVTPPLPFSATCNGCAGATLSAVCSGCMPGQISGMTPVNLTVAITNSSLFNPGQASVTVSSTAAATVTLPLALVGPSISEVLDAAGFGSALVPGEWAAIFGNNLSTATGPWGPSDFPNGTTLLPTSLSGVSVAFNGIRAPVYYVSPTQINVQVPASVGGSVPVVVTTSGGLVTQAFNATVAANAPTLFTYPAGNNTWAAAQHNGGALIGDPAVEPGTTKAKPGETIVIYVNGLAASPSGMEVAGIPYTASPVTVSFNSTSVNASYAGVSFAGGFQVNVVVPASLKPGNYALTVSTLGQASQPGVILPVGP